MKTFIAIPTFNRLFVTKMCLKQLNESVKGENVNVQIYDDMSVYDPIELKDLADDIHRFSNHMGINASRKFQFKDFYENTDCDFMYLTDPDAFHDTEWLKKAFEIYNKYELPVSLYNSQHHLHKTIFQYKQVMIRHYAAGISILLHRDHVKQILDGMNSMNGTDWDFDIGNILGNKFAVSLTSYLDHYGAYGLHNRDWNWDKAVNPTPFLRDARKENIFLIEKNIAAMTNEINKNLIGMFGVGVK